MKDHLTWITFLIATLAFSNLSNAQNTLTFEIVDTETGKPVRDAFLFIQNSTIGTTTDKKGLAILKIKNLESFDLVITHINYINAFISSDQLNANLNRILLEPNPVDLQEVIVRTKKRNAKKRKGWMRRFQSEIFGQNIKGRQMKLLNPGALWFEEDEGTLKAHAIDNLKISNDFMGYQLQLVLDHFSVTQEGDVRYVGRLFFEDKLTQMKQAKQIRKRRSKFYLESRQLFFLSLMHQLPLNNQRFEFGITTAKEDQTYSYTPLSIGDLDWKRGTTIDTLLFDDYLTIINKQLIVHNIKNQRSNSGSKVRPTTSFLRSTTGQFILDQNGRILNTLDIEESGHWSNYRLGVELPIDYDGGIQINSPYRILDSLAIYTYQIPPEKVFLHTNKTYFSNREQLWFKGYLVDGISHRPVTQSQVLYVDLINPEQEIIQTWELHAQRGFEGDFQFTRNQDPGIYYLRGYTNFMRNQDDAYFFEQPLNVVDFLEENERTTSNNQFNQQVREPEVLFFPEGGDLVAGLSANVAFQVKDQSGVPIEIKGYVNNEKAEELLRVKTYHQGMGLFSFIPESGQTYSLNFTYDSRSYKFALPEVLSTGMTLHINAAEAEDLYLQVEASDSLLLQNALLIGHSRGNIFLKKQQLQANQSFKVPKDQTPKGLLHFTLFDSNQRPQAERLCFNDYDVEKSTIQFSEIAQTANSPQLKIIQMECDPSIRGVYKDLSASIINLNSITNTTTDIKSYLLLESDLTYTIPNAPYYLNEINSVKRFYLDLLLLGQTWRRFKWKSLLDGNALQAIYEPELGYSINGYTTRKEDSTRVQTEIMLNSFDQNIVYKKIRTDALGNFSFSQLPAFDSTTYLLQARINKGKNKKLTDGEVQGNRLVGIHLAPRSPAPFDHSKPVLFQSIDYNAPAENQVQLYREKSLTDDQYSTADWTIDLEGVEITAKRKYASNRPLWGNKLYNLDAVDWIAPETKGTELLAKLAPRFTFTPGPEGKLLAHVFTDEGEFITVPVQIIIDGMGAEPGGSNALPFLSLPADAIQNMYIGRTSISVTTRDVPRTRAAYLESGILQYTHSGYYQARAFSLPSYPTNQGYDLRSTILWEPNVRFDQSGKAVLKFEASPFPTPYQIKIMGITETGQAIAQSYIIGN